MIPLLSGEIKQPLGGMMYPVLLAIHNIFRWVVLIMTLVALFRAYSGWLGKREWNPGDKAVGSFYAVSLDLQLLLGLGLYFIGSWFEALVSDFSGAMQNDVLRFFTLEHAFYMLLAVIVVHAGNVLARRAPESVLKHRRAAIAYTLVALFLIVGIPWWRPLFPGLG
jgi:hypothetical protein